MTTRLEITKEQRDFIIANIGENFTVGELTVSITGWQGKRVYVNVEGFPYKARNGRRAQAWLDLRNPDDLTVIMQSAAPRTAKKACDLFEGWIEEVAPF